MVIDPAVGKAEMYHDRPHRERFKGLNDLHFAQNGDLYFTDQGESGLHDPTGRLWRLRHSGRLDLLLHNVPSPNGLVLTPDETILYLAVTRGNAVWRVPLHPDGSIGRVGIFIQLSGGMGPDGMAMDSEGNLAVCHVGMGSVWIFSRLGRPLYELPSCAGHATTNAAFGGPDGRTLYITESETGTILMAQACRSAGLRLCSHINRRRAGPAWSAPLDLGGGAIENDGDRAHLVGAERPATEPDRQRGLQILHGAPDFGRRTAAIGAGDLRHPREDLVDDGLVGGEEPAAPSTGYRELLARALGGVGPDVAELLEQGQRRVDHPGARAVEPAEFLLDRLDQLVAMTRLLGDQAEQHIAQIAVVEEAPEPAAAASAMAVPGETAAEHAAARVAPVVVVCVSMSKHSRIVLVVAWGVYAEGSRSGV